MSAVCPNGHTSESTDYCDTCGAPIAEGAANPAPDAPAAAAPAAPPTTNSLDLPPAGGGPKECPNCQTVNTPESLFCEACGYDFTTGALPAGVASVPAESAPAQSAPDETPGGSGELAGLRAAEELDADGLSVSASGMAGEGEPGPGEPGELGDPGEPGEFLDLGEPAPGTPTGTPDTGEGAETGDPAGGPGHAGSPAPDGGGEPEHAEPETELEPNSEPGGGEGESAAGPDGGAGVGSGSSGVPPRIAFQWVAEVWIDPDWYADQQAPEPLPSAGLPVVVPLRVASALIGRKSASRSITPDIDCSADPGVSRRHAQLTTDGSRWFVEDLRSSNGTFIGPASGPLPDDPIAPGSKTEVGDERIYVGAWTRIVVRRATDEEIAIG